MPAAPLTPAYDPQVARDLAVLTALAHLGWLTTEQLHTLCFADASRVTVRLTLRALAEAGWLAPIRWWIGSRRGGQLWAVLPKGVEQLQRYRPVVAPCVPRDLGRPSSALERAEWMAQCVTRSFVVMLIQAARQTAVLAAMEIALPPWPPDQSCLAPPDARLTIVWAPAQRQTGTWLPWSESALDATGAQRYQLHIVRAGDPDPARLVPPLGRTSHLAILLFQTAAHYEQTQARLLRTNTIPVRLTTWDTLAAGLSGAVWRDAVGQPCTLAPQPHETDGGA